MCCMQGIQLCWIYPVISIFCVTLLVLACVMTRNHQTHMLSWQLTSVLRAKSTLLSPSNKLTCLCTTFQLASGCKADSQAQCFCYFVCTCKLHQHSAGHTLLIAYNTVGMCAAASGGSLCFMCFMRAKYRTSIQTHIQLTSRSSKQQTLLREITM